MKKLFLIGAFLLGLFTVQNIYSQEPLVNYGNAPCEDQPCGECWCRYVRYTPCYYTTKRCVEEQVPCCKKCCRYVPQYYSVQCCRYVPQYYPVQRCRYVPEYYDVQEYKCCKKTICEPCCKYVPKYYWKRTCAPQCAPQGCLP